MSDVAEDIDEYGFSGLRHSFILRCSQPPKWLHPPPTTAFREWWRWLSLVSERPLSANMPYSLRQAVESDLEPMMRIGHEGIRPYVEQLWAWDQADQERRFRETFDLARISIVRIDDRDAGYMDVENHDDHVFLAGIYLDTDYRCRGVGSELIGDLLNSCRELHKPLRLRVLRPNPAQRLYLRLGFHPVKETETHIYMEAAPYGT